MSRNSSHHGTAAVFRRPNPASLAWAAAGWLVACSGWSFGDVYTAVDQYTLSPPAGGVIAIPGYYQAAAGSQVVGASGDSPYTGAHALVWNGAGQPIDLNPLGAAGSIAHSTIGYEQVGFANGFVQGQGYQNHAFLWGGSAQNSIDLHPTNLTYFRSSEAYGTNGLQHVGAGTVVSPGDSIDALLWNGAANTAVDLSPTNLTGMRFTFAYGTNGNQQVGTGGESSYHALLWNGTSVATDLTPTGVDDAAAEATDGNHQVGYAQATGAATSHAMMWSGTAESQVDLNPTLLTGFDTSQARSVSGTRQAGFGSGSATGGNDHALLWRGTADSATDLHQRLPGSFVSSRAYSIDGAGDVYGTAVDSSGNYHSIQWVAPPVTSTSILSKGTNQRTSVEGRSPTAGGVDAEFPTITADGTFSSTNALSITSDLAARTAPLPFASASQYGLVQTWDLSFTGKFNGSANITFHYDPAELGQGVIEQDLRIEHFANGLWVELPGAVDAAADDILVQADGFSPFALAVVPEPSAAALLAVSGIGLLGRRRRRQRDLTRHRAHLDVRSHKRGPR